MSSPITSVAMIGGGNHVGLDITTLLLSSGFTVAALINPDSDKEDEASKLPPTVRHHHTDFTHASLVSCLSGAQAIVAVDISDEIMLEIVVAAIEAKVTRFITGQLAALAHEPWQRKLKLFEDNWAFREQLRELCEASTNDSLSWTVVEHGPFPSFGLGMLRSRTLKATIVDGGDEKYAITSYEDLARAVVGILTHPEETKNRAVQILTGYVTPNKVVEAAKERMPGEWTVRHVTAEEHLQEAEEELKRANPNGSIWAFNQARVAFGSKLLSRTHEGKDNELLGVKQRSDEEALEYALSYKKK